MHSLRQRPILGATLCFLLVAARATSIGSESGSSTVRLWGALSVTVPKGVRVNLRSSPHRLEPAAYIFTAAKGQHVILTARLGIFIDPRGGDFFSKRDIAKSKHIVLNGMRVWSRQDGSSVKMDVKLPKAKACVAQDYVLLAYTHGDNAALGLVKSLRPIIPYTCLSAVP